MRIFNEKLLKIFSIVLFICYLILLIWIVVFKCNYNSSMLKTYGYFSQMNLEQRFKFFLVPFNDYFIEPFTQTRMNTFQDDMLNIAIFIPLGLYTSYFIKNKKFLKTLGIAFILSATFEVFQLFSLVGAFASKDLITNLLGAILGYLIFRLIYKKNNGVIRLTILNVLSIFAIITFVPIAIFAIVNTIQDIDIYIEIFTRKI